MFFKKGIARRALALLMATVMVMTMLPASGFALAADVEEIDVPHVHTDEIQPSEPDASETPETEPESETPEVPEPDVPETEPETDATKAPAAEPEPVPDGEPQEGDAAAEQPDAPAADGDVTEPETDGETTTLKVKAPAGWTQVYWYAWNDSDPSTAGNNNSWPGLLMTYDEASGCWTCTTEVQYEWVIFGNGGPSKGENQTYNSVWPGTGEFTYDLSSGANWDTPVLPTDGHTFDKGICTDCGAYEKPELLDGVWQIDNAGKLFWFAAYINGDPAGGKALTVVSGGAVEYADAMLTANVTLVGEWTPIGTAARPYTGTFDGSEKTIYRLSITTGSENLGLFGYCKNAEIRNISVSGTIALSANASYVGGLVGYMTGGSVKDVLMWVDISNTAGELKHVGGAIGSLYGGVVERVWNASDLTIVGSYDCIGGVVGYMTDSTIRNCYNTAGTISTTESTNPAGAYVGGILGYCNSATAVIENCFNYSRQSRDFNGRVSDDVGTYCGAIVGWLRAGSVKNCYYLDISCDKGIGTSAVSAEVTAKTQLQFRYGEVAWLLNNGVTDGTQVWYQSVVATEYPHPSRIAEEGFFVYKVDEDLYSNDPNPKFKVTGEGGSFTDVSINSAFYFLNQYIVPINDSKAYTITLLDDLEENVGQNYDLDITLTSAKKEDGTDYTLSGNNFTAYVVNQGTLTVQGGTLSGSSGLQVNVAAPGSVTVQGGSIKGTQRGILVTNTGTLTLENAEVTSDNYGIYASSGMTVIKSGEVTGGTYGLYLASNAKAEVEGGVLCATANGGYGGYICSTADATISGGDFSALGDNGCGFLADSGTTVTIYDGSFSADGANGCGIRVCGKTGDIYDGTFSAAGENGSGILVNSIGTASVFGGTFQGSGYGIRVMNAGTANISGGTFTASAESGRGLSVEEWGNASLTGGTFSGAAAAVYANSNYNQNVGQLLAGGYLYYSGEVTSGEHITEGLEEVSLAEGTVTVGSCDHDVELEWADNGDGTHTATCGVCQKVLSEPHTCTEENLICDVCGMGAMAAVTIDGETTYHAAAADAWAAAKGHTATVRLLQNCSVDTALSVETGDDITVEMAEGVTLDGGIQATGGKLTVKNGKYAGSYEVSALDITGGEVEIIDGTVTGFKAVTVSGGKLTVYGGVIEAYNPYISDACALYVTGGDVQLYGGTFTNQENVVEAVADSIATAGDCYVWQLLAPGYCYNGLDGEMWKMGKKRQEVSEPLIVVKCEHWDELTDNDDGTHSGYCYYCYTDIEPEPHQWGEDGVCIGCRATSVAGVTVDGETTYYMSFAEAWTDATAADTAVIKLLSSVDLGEAYAAMSSGDITLEMAPEVTLTGSRSSGLIRVNGGILTMASGTLENTFVGSGNTRANGVTVNLSGTFNLTGGTVMTTGDLSYGIYLNNSPDATVNISGGTVSGVLAGVQIDYYGALNISGDAVISATGTQGYGVYAKGSAYLHDAVINVHGGTISGGTDEPNSMGLYMGGGSLIMTGGNVLSGVQISSNASGNITGGVIEKQLCVNSGHASIANCTISGSETRSPSHGVFVWGGTLDIYDGVTITATSSQSHGIYVSNGTLNVYGNVTATATGYSSDGIQVSGASTVNIENGSFTCQYQYGLYVNSTTATVTLSGGTFTGYATGIRNDSGVKAILAEGCVYYNADGQHMTYTDTTKQLTGVVTVALCDHDAALDWTDDGAGNHTATCSICQEFLSEPHSWAEDMTCEVCGTAAVASVTVDDETTYYTSFNDAWSDATSADTAVLKLLHDVDLGDESITMSSGDVTLDMEPGVTLTGSPAGVLVGGVNNTVGGLIHVTGGTLTMTGGTVQNTYTNPEGVPGIAYGAAVAVGGTGTFQLEGGQVLATGELTAAVLLADSMDAAVSLSGGTVSGTSYGVFGYMMGTLNISDGAVVRAGDSGCAIKLDSNPLMNDGDCVQANISGGTVSGRFAIEQMGGHVTITGGQVGWIELAGDAPVLDVTGGQTGWLIVNSETAVANLSNCTVETDDDYVAAVNVLSGTLNINGGTKITSKNESGLRLDSGTVNIRDGAEISGLGDYRYGIEVDDGQLNVYGGSFYGTRYGLGQFGGTAVLSGGTFSGEEGSVRATAGVGAMLAADCVYYNTDGEIAATARTEDGYLYVTPVTVGRCEHQWGDWFIEDGNHVRICALCGQEDTVPHHDDDGDQLCDICGQIMGAYLYSRSITLGGDIGINYYMELSDEVLANADECRMVFELNGEFLSASQVDRNNTYTDPDTGKTYYRFTVWVAAAQMTDSVTAHFEKDYIDDEDEQVEIWNDNSKTDYCYSVLQYAAYVIENQNSDEYTAELVNLVKAMLNYGGKAQKVFNYHTDTCADANLGDFTLLTPELEEYKPTLTNGESIPGLRFYGASLILQSETSLRFYFEVDEDFDLDSYGSVVLVPGRGMFPVELVQKTQTYYYIEISDIGADALGEMYTVYIGPYGTESTDDMLAVTYGPMSYVYRTLSETSTASQEVKDVAIALYNYHRYFLAWNETRFA